MNASKTLTIYIIGGLIIGAIAGYGLGYLTYQPQRARAIEASNLFARAIATEGIKGTLPGFL